MLLRYLVKGRYLISILFFTFLIFITRIYLINLYANLYNSESEDRCTSKLISIKYQLKAVTDYKHRIEKLLTEMQNKHEAYKERFKDIMESCGAMKQHIGICQSQFEDLQSECKTVKEDYDKLKKDTENLKTS